MTPRPPALALLAATLALGCGGAPSSDVARFGLELRMSQALVDQISTFQVVVLPDGKQRECTELQRRCLRQQVKQEEALVLSDGDGTEGRALRFPVSLAGGAQQDVAIEVPVGRDYVLIIEAISQDTPPRFLGSSCTYLDAVNSTRNDPVLTTPMTLNSVDCDPTFDP